MAGHQELKVLVVGDTHFKVTNTRETDAMSDAVIRVIQEKRPDLIVNLGDTLNDHEKVHVIAQVKAYDFLDRQSQLVPMLLLMGNHDLKNQKQFCSKEHPFTALKYWGPRITVVDDVHTLEIKGHTIISTPYVPPERFAELLQRCPNLGQATCVLGHIEIKNCQMGAVKSVNGAEWPLTNPLLIAGHIHDYQELQPNVIYTGTPIQHSYGDTHDKTISLFTFRSPTDYTHERIDLGLPKKHIVRITCAEVSSYVPRTNCDLKIIIKGTAGDIRAITKHPNITLWKTAGHKISYRDVPLEYAHNDNLDRRALNKAPPRFSQAFYGALLHNPRLTRLYEKHFGSVRTTTLIISQT
jgi:predicted MPP superfamily phosphohydrolase